MKESLGVFATPADLFNEAANLVESSPSLACGMFMDTNGCHCALGLVAYKHDKRFRTAVDGFRALKEAHVLDEDQVAIIADQIDTQGHHAFVRLTVGLNVEPGDAVMHTNDRLVREGKTRAEVAAGIRALIKEFPVGP